MGSDTFVDSKMPRVLISGHLPPPMSGIGTYYETLLGSSLPKRMRTKFIDTSSRRRPGSETGLWSFSNLTSAIGDCISFASAIVRFRPEICHIATAFGLSFLKHAVCIGIARLLGSKVLLHPHCSFYFLYERQGKAWQRLVREVIKLCHGVAVLSNEWRRLQEVVPGCRTYYLPNGINLLKYVDVGRERIQSKREKACLHVLYLGHLGRAKGSFDLVSAAKMVLRQQSGVVFDLVGQEHTVGEMRQLTAQVAEAGLDRFIHIRSAVAGEEKIELFRAADIFVYPSYHEGMPMAVIEAMACGLPIIATQVGGLPDLVHAGLNGMLLPVSCPEKLADAICQLVDNREMRHSMQTSSFRRAQEEFDIENLVCRLLDVYRELSEINERPVGACMVRRQ